MNRVIYKYPFSPLDGICEIRTGDVPIVRHVGQQADRWFAWIEHDARTGLKDTAVLMIIGTGQPFSRTEPPIRHVATITDGPFVWHVHQVIR